MSNGDQVKTIRFDPSGGGVTVEVMLGQAQLGKYSLILFDSDGKNPQEFGVGNNVDNLPDVFVVPSPASTLTGKLLGWNMIITTPASGPGQLYFARVKVMQDDRDLDDGPFEDGGPIDDAKIIMGWAKFVG